MSVLSYLQSCRLSPLRRSLFALATTSCTLPAQVARVCWLLLVAGSLPAAFAAPVTFISGATAQVDADPPGNNNFSFVADIGQQTSASASTSFSYNVGGTVVSTASSQANLQAGTVKVGTALTMSNQDDGFVAMATGFIGDGYRHFAGNDPFTWTSTTSARFDIRLTGNSSMSGNVRDLFNSSVMFLMIYPKNTLDDFVPFCGAFQSYFWSIGPSDSRPAPCGGGFLDSFDGAVDETVSLLFNHPGDFDWAFGIRVGGAASAHPNTTVTWLNNYLGTAELFYTPPEGVTSIQSGSGFVLAQGTANTVPLPSSLALLSLGLVAMVAVRRRAPARAAVKCALQTEDCGDRKKASALRHCNGPRKLNRTSSHRLAMLRNMCNSLIALEAIKTTMPKAKEPRSVGEPLITRGAARAPRREQDLQ